MSEHLKQLESDVERLHVENAELRRRIGQLERALSRAEAERDRDNAGASRTAAMRADVTQILSVVLDVRRILLEEVDENEQAQDQDEEAR